MGLFDLFKKKETNHLGEDLSKLTKDGEIPWGWYYANLAFTQQIDAEYELFLNTFIEAKKRGVRAEHVALSSLVKYEADVQRLCASKGECFVKWASVRANHPASMEDHKERLRYLEENMDELLKQEAALKTLRQDLVSIISGEPGVVQSDLYKRFDASLKANISNELYQMEAQNMIVREKSGRSYKLYIK